jgi:hypothetical protein
MIRSNAGGNRANGEENFNRPPKEKSQKISLLPLLAPVQKKLASEHIR